jgi:hypothetical protein
MEACGPILVLGHARRAGFKELPGALCLSELPEHIHVALANIDRAEMI